MANITFKTSLIDEIPQRVNAFIEKQIESAGIEILEIVSDSRDGKSHPAYIDFNVDSDNYNKLKSLAIKIRDCVKNSYKIDLDIHIGD